MLRRYLTLFTILILCARCGDHHKNALKSSSKVKAIVPKKVAVDTLDEEFIDSTKIGIKGRYKLELRKYHCADSFFVKIAFFERLSGFWLKKQDITSEASFVDCDVQIVDFNNDGFKDMTFHSAVAARGANEVRKLFIFNKPSGKLIFIKNSENYPNMQYNKKLNCIDALLVSGSWVTVFLHLEKDSLREIASVDVRDNILNLTITDRNGKERHIIKDKKVNYDMFPRFKNYNPLELDDEE